MPIAEDLGVAYEIYYTHQMPTQTPADPLRALIKLPYRFVKLAAEALLGLPREREHLRSMCLEQTAPGRLLEVGSGQGEFLARMRARGWQVQGIDPDPRAAHIARERYGIEVAVGAMESARYAPGSFDAITMNHVIEHVFDPVGLLKQCYELLAENGRMVIVTPNADSLGHGLLGRDWRGLEPPRHLHIFSPRTMRRAVDCAGLEHVAIRTSAANADIILDASLRLSHTPEGARLGRGKPSIRDRARLMQLQLREARALRAKPDLGEELVMVATKLA